VYLLINPQRRLLENDGVVCNSSIELSHVSCAV